MAQCNEMCRYGVFPHFGGPKLAISEKVRAISQKWRNFKKIVIFTLFGPKYIKKIGGKHDLRIGHFDAHP